ncbi:MAG: phosphatase PAP2 family protein [Chloroherpetonaceae bacterium]|nr:phosphatase PAP2 family protein [Chloroherpetonaceae bacterium]MCS7210453.1 phosphatase PAP2 family protein [Chloroherpetonaceae bacterium]MDW8018855.1 phosphatase PAP2 family protein [Chloroherpetonaceae bacterium]MDW8466700.1 phosphatase PAP2 family protein [Chloroherpetonaceae bacterium]
MLSEWNTKLFFFINSDLKHPINDLWLGYSTHLGNAAVLFPIAVLVLLLYDRKAFWRNFGYLALAGLLGGIVVTEAKLFFNAPRPLALFQEAIASGNVVVNVMFEPLYAHSFPSGHSQVAFTVAHSLAYLCVRWHRAAKGALYAMATVIALSRVYVGAHFPADVLAGACLGVATASGAFWLLNKVQAWHAARALHTVETVSENSLHL